jgi:methylglutaconyl-CoA hydratase
VSVTIQDLAPKVKALTLCRPEKRNALHLPLIKQFVETLQALGEDGSLRVLVIRGEGPVFCSGMDISEYGEEFKRYIPLLYKTLYQFPIVTCALVQGAALGGGAGLAACCDIVVGETKALFGCPETRCGLVAAHILPYLMRKMDHSFLREFLLSGRLYNSEQAKQGRLVNHIADESDFLPQALALAQEVVQGAPQATRLTKELLRLLSPNDLEKDVATASKYGLTSMGEEEPNEGKKAFLEKRAPCWTL